MKCAATFCAETAQAEILLKSMLWSLFKHPKSLFVVQSYFSASGPPPIQTRVVLSMARWTNESIGCTMNGIVPRPRPVVIHLRVTGASRGVSRARPKRDAAQIRLIVKPGIMTEARAWKKMFFVKIQTDDVVSACYGSKHLLPLFSLHMNYAASISCILTPEVTHFASPSR